MSSLVGKKAPSFKATAVVNGGEMSENFSLDQYIGKKYVVFFFYPKDFTFVCPTELHAFQEKLKEFESRNVAVVACSTDTEESHWGWLQMSKKEGGIKGVTYPIVADTTKTISLAYGTLFGDYDVNEAGELIATGPSFGPQCG
jgi:peroxiredoxin 2/4